MKVKELSLLEVLNQEVLLRQRRYRVKCFFFFFSCLQIGTVKVCLYADGNSFRVREKLMVQKIEGIIAGQLSLNKQKGMN